MAKPRLCFAVVSEPLRGQQFSFDSGQAITIGRTSDNMLPLDHKSVSRRHARVEGDGGSYVLVDLGSHNGTRVGDKLISKHPLQSGDVFGLGEILVKFTVADDSAAPPGAGANLPAVVAATTAQAGALARPLTFDDVFGAAGATVPIEAPKVRRNLWPAIYAGTMAMVVALGLGAFLAVGRREVGPPRVDVLVAAGGVAPVDLSRVPDPDRRRFSWGITGRIDRRQIGTPTDQKVAIANPSPFKGFVSIRGLSQGMTDIAVSGPPVGRVIIRVVVRGIKPQRYAQTLLDRGLAERNAFAQRVLERARNVIRQRGLVTEHSWSLAQELDDAARLLEPLNKLDDATWAAQTAQAIRRALNDRYERLAREIDILVEQGKLRDAVAKAGELKLLFPDDESEEHHVCTRFYERLLEDADRKEREEQEKR